MHGDIRKNIERHIPVSDAEFGHFMSYMTPRKFRKRQYLVQQGDFTRHSFYVVKGCIRAFQLDNSGKEHIIQFGLEDWWTGDIAALTPGNQDRMKRTNTEE